MAYHIIGQLCVVRLREIPVDDHLIDAVNIRKEPEMLRTPVLYKSMHTIKFSDLDPYNHVRTALYSAYYVDHRMEGLREQMGWNLKTLATLPFMIWIRRM